MPSEVRMLVLVVLGGIGLVWYYISLIAIGLKKGPLNNPTTFQQFQLLSITTISTTLATFVGLILGLRSLTDEVEKKKNTVDEIKQVAAKGQGDNVQPSKESGAQAGVPAKVEAQASEVAKGLQHLINVLKPNWFQWAAVILYLVSLCLALYFWWRAGSAEIDPVISSLGKSLLGLLVGAMSAALAVPAAA
jgi:hypothetical protein